VIHIHLARKFLEQSLLLWLGCALALFSFNWVRVWVVSLIDMGRFQIILEQFREFERFAPISFDQLFTYAGRIGMAFDEPIVIFCIVVWGIARGSDVVSGELNRGTMEMLLAQPLSRKQFVLTHAAVSICGLALLAVSAWMGIWIGVQFSSVEETVAPPSLQIPLIGYRIPITFEDPEKSLVFMRDIVDCSVFLPSTLNLFAFGFFVLALTCLMSSWDRYRWRTIGIVIAIYVFQLVVFGLGKAAEQLHWLTHLSFFDLYRPQPIAKAVMEHGHGAAWSLIPFDDTHFLGPFAFTLILLLAGAIFYAAALRIFARRDLPAPL
jgi:ABC-2 type transport system permease protein